MIENSLRAPREPLLPASCPQSLQRASAGTALSAPPPPEPVVTATLMSSEMANKESGRRRARSRAAHKLETTVWSLDIGPGGLSTLPV